MINRFAFANQQHNSALVSGGDMMNVVVCPTPRRLRLLNPSISESIPCHHNSLFHQTESKTRTELLDTILTKECYDGEKVNNLVPTSPPFFCGSPPSRASNPVVQDAQFGNEDLNLCSHAFEASPSSAARGTCGRGQKHPVVRVEGFNFRGISVVA